MKYKIIISLAVLLTGSLSASPNKCGKGVRCATNTGKQTTIAPVRTVVMIDEAELLPMHHYLNKF